jgi:hypothetical protein
VFDHIREHILQFYNSLVINRSAGSLSWMTFLLTPFVKLRPTDWRVFEECEVHEVVITNNSDKASSP